MKTIYVSGAISAKTKGGVSKNIKIARKWAYKIWKTGKFGVFCPHMNDAGAHSYGVSYVQLLLFDLQMIKKCDALFMIPENWRKSSGAMIEHNYAKWLGKPIFYSFNKLIKYTENKTTFAKKRELKFMRGDINHADQDFTKVNHLKEMEEECLDLSNYAMGLQRYSKLPLRWFAGLVLRMMSRFIYWIVSLLLRVSSKK